MDFYNDELNHSGVLGMKHGVRRWQYLDGTWTEAGKARRRKREGTGRPKDSKRVVTAKKQSENNIQRDVSSEKKIQDSRKSIRNMSDDEIREEISRLKLTKELKNLRSDTESRGKKFVMNVLEDIGKETLKNIGTQAATHFLGTAVNELFGVADINDKDYIAKRIVNPQKGQGSDGDNRPKDSGNGEKKKEKKKD